MALLQVRHFNMADTPYRREVIPLHKEVTAPHLSNTSEALNKVGGTLLQDLLWDSMADLLKDDLLGNMVDHHKDHSLDSTVGHHKDHRRHIREATVARLKEAFLLSNTINTIFQHSPHQDMFSVQQPRAMPLEMQTPSVQP